MSATIDPSRPLSAYTEKLEALYPRAVALLEETARSGPNEKVRRQAARFIKRHVEEQRRSAERFARVDEAIARVRAKLDAGERADWTEVLDLLEDIDVKVLGQDRAMARLHRRVRELELELRARAKEKRA